ncbi:response regulator [Fusibacter paucivorans]|uniref:Stage 0 sporulation protein A homolog n=1 Tax=Fusibacter paucivorans TaxID=76009 RepID=A0ABS5PML1_9FIRM|nr:HD domain-containing phosphohydrolase [Fusibacter paucivorans]MBS7525634.1 response regulator [Fusibacter paucivorans]
MYNSRIIQSRKNENFEVLIVDDNPQNLKVLSEILKRESYRVRTTTSGKLALKSLAMKPVDLILLDINMPELSGYEVAERLKADDALNEIPVILITALSSIEDKLKGFKTGAVDYITKPFMLEEVLARVDTHLKLKEARRLLKMENQNLEKMVNEKVLEITSAHLTTVFAMVELAESRDDDTGKHVKRIGEYCRKLSELLRESGYDLTVDDSFVHNIYIASPLHDIGKIGISDAILLKPGKLTADEFEIIKTHVVIGAEKLEAVSSVSPDNKFLQMGARIARYHHEKWDGSGYMAGLSETAIPIEARIMAIADVYDALRSKRIYKHAYIHDEALQIMREGRSKHFDPTLLDLFFKHADWFDLQYNRLSGKS